MMNKYSNITAQPEYDHRFWDEMRNKAEDTGVISRGMSEDTSGYELPSSAAGDLMEVITNESVFRQIATRMPVLFGGNHILAKDYDDIAAFVPAGGVIPGVTGNDDFRTIPVDRHKLAVMIKLSLEIIGDENFPLEDYLIKRLGKNFGRAEDQGFIQGTGTDEPLGILASTGGAETGVSTAALSYDDVLTLYHSVDMRYRKNAVWLMNDNTALSLRKLKDDANQPIWKGDMLLGKPVMISEYMPDIEPGKKPIAFGDFSYYYIVDRDAVSMLPIKELYAANGLIGYMAYEFLDGKLIRKDAVKVIEITSA